MIDVERVDKKYLRCQSCYAKENLLQISIALAGGAHSSIRICHDCVKELHEKALEKMQ